MVRKSCTMAVLALFTLGVGMALGYGVPEKMQVKGALPQKMDGVAMPKSGEVPMTLGIYDQEGGLLWCEKHTVSLGRNATYEVVLGEQTPIPAELFLAGDELWLGVTVHVQDDESARDVEIFPRQPLVPVAAYAFKAQYAERLVEQSQVSSAADEDEAATGTGTTESKTVTEKKTTATARATAGTVTSVTAGAGLSRSPSTGYGDVTIWIPSAAITTAMLKGSAVKNAKIAPGAVTPDKISGTGAASGQVLKYDGTAVKWANDLAGTVSLPWIGEVYTVGEYSTAMGVKNTGDGYAVKGESTNNSAVHGLTSSGNLNHAGVWGKSTGAGPGVAGSSFAGGVGVFGAGSNWGAGVYGYGASGYGVYGESNAEDESSAGGGVAAYDVYHSNWAIMATKNEAFTATAYEGNGANVYSFYGDGVASGAIQEAKSGLFGYTWNNKGYGVFGWNMSDFQVFGYLGGNNGAAGENYREQGIGVYGTGWGSYGMGVAGVAKGYMGVGVEAEATGNSSTALRAINWASDGLGLYVEGGQYGLAAKFKGNVTLLSRSSGATIMELGEGLDYAEGFDVARHAGVQPGAVLVIDPEQPGKLTLSNRPYDTKVAGIVAGAKGLGSGVRLGGDQYAHNVALAGRVYCNVDATYGRVSPGDLLTTSPTEGHAMKVKDHAKARGAILGKAMEGLDRGRKGQILVLVTLQ